MDKTARRVYVNGEERNFTTKEFDLLTFLMENPNTSPRILSISSFFADTIKIGIFFALRIFLHISNPSSPGNIKSSMVASNEIVEIRGIKVDKTARRVYVNGEERNFTTISIMQKYISDNCLYFKTISYTPNCFKHLCID